MDEARVHSTCLHRIAATAGLVPVIRTGDGATTDGQDKPDHIGMGRFGIRPVWFAISLVRGVGSLTRRSVP
jgi:hypothetical protein